MWNNNNYQDPYGTGCTPANWSNTVNNVPNMFNGNTQNNNDIQEGNPQVIINYIGKAIPVTFFECCDE